MLVLIIVVKHFIVVTIPGKRKLFTLFERLRHKKQRTLILQNIFQGMY